MDFDSFQHSHGTQLASIPRVYWRALYEKLQYEVYDAGKHFRMSHGEDGWSVVVSSTGGLREDDPSCIFLVDHAWTFQAECAQKQLEVISGLAARMGSLMGLTDEEEEEEGSYDADSESGNEVEEWPDSRSESPVDQSQQPASPDDTTCPCPHDGYVSGDLGDVSCDHTLDGPDSDSDQDNGPKGVKLKNNSMAAETGGVEGCGQDNGGGCGQDDVEVGVVTKGEEPVLSVSLPTAELVQAILKSMWRYSHTYHISNSLVPMWYIMDEFGSRIQHSPDPTVSMLAFFYIPTQLAYTVFWPVKNLEKGDCVTSDFVPPGVKPGLGRACHTLVWSRDGHMSLDDPLWSELDEFTVPQIEERCNEDIPDAATPPVPPLLNYSVYTDMKVVEQNLTHPSFHCVSERKDADILWLMEHFKDFRSLDQYQLVNQFPCENVLTCKDLLVIVSKRSNGGVAPSWLPLTFNLLYELPKFVHCYLERKQRDQDNMWIVKPWNLGRGLDIHISEDLVKLIRLAQSGPKIVSKYITAPVLFHRPDVGWVKFDYRYIVLLSSVSPLELYIYNVFWLRFANKPFTLDDVSDYEVHFTVMNYKPQTVLKQIHYNDFIPLFEEQYPDIKWSTIQEKTCQLFKELFTSAGAGMPPNSIAHWSQSRAIYAADLMLERVESSHHAHPSFEPRLLEMNYSPDCNRACQYHPEFYNHIFQALFMGTTQGLPVTRIV